MTSRSTAVAAIVLAAMTLSACDSSGSSSQAPASSAPPATSTTSSSTTTTTTTTTTTAVLPGTGKPSVTIGDENDTEQFVLGELYYEALKAEGFHVLIDQNIGPEQIRLQQLHDGGTNGGIDMYPEYLNVWNTQFAGDTRHFKTWQGADRAAQDYAFKQGLKLLTPTPFSDTAGIAVTVLFAQENHLGTVASLGKVAATMALGGPPQFKTDEIGGLPVMEELYGFAPANYKVLEIGNQYQALDQDTVQAVYVNTTDGEFTTGNYRLLTDTKEAFGIGNVVPVVTVKALDAEGPAFAATVNRVSALLTLPVIRELNAQVDLSGETPAGVASRFLADHGLIPPNSVITS